MPFFMDGRVYDMENFISNTFTLYLLFKISENVY